MSAPWPITQVFSLISPVILSVSVAGYHPGCRDESSLSARASDAALSRSRLQLVAADRSSKQGAPIAQHSLTMWLVFTSRILDRFTGMLCMATDVRRAGVTPRRDPIALGGYMFEHER